MSKLRWFGFGTSGQNQTFGSIQTRSVMLIFISSFKILIIFNSGRIKQTCATLVFRKILTLLRMWRHHSASLQKYSKVEYVKERQSPYLGFVFYFKSISCLGFAWEHDKKDTFSQYFKFRQMSYRSQCQATWQNSVECELNILIPFKCQSKRIFCMVSIILN